MSKGLFFVGGLIIGCAGGSLLSYRILKQDFDQRLEEEASSIRNALLEEAKKRREQGAKTPETKQKAKTAIQKYGSEDTSVLDKTPPPKKPYPIPPEILEAPDNPYTTIALKMYADGSVFTLNRRKINGDQLKELIGDTLQQFSDDDDRLCVRNEATSTDYEIVRLPYCYEDEIRNDFS